VARTPPSDSSTGPDEADSQPSGKGHATPSRKEQEAAHRRPLVPKDRRLAARQSREQQAGSRQKARIGMAKGDERYLPSRDKGPQKRFARDFVDARFNVGEILLPMLVIVILTYFFPEVATFALLAVWFILAVVAVDCISLAARIRRKLGEKFGADKVERGIRLYVTMRAIQLRPLRLPKPQVRRGDTPS
jgi:hypothetical protein